MPVSVTTVELDSQRPKIVRAFPTGGTIKLTAISGGAQVNVIGAAPMKYVDDSVSIPVLGTAVISVTSDDGRATITLSGAA